MAEQGIRRNKLTGEVAIQNGDGWEIFSNEEAVARGVMTAVAQGHPDIPQLQNSVTKFLQRAQSRTRDALSPYVGDTASSLISGVIPGSAPELAGDAALMAVAGPAGKLARPLFKAGARVLAPTAASTGTAMATGEDPVSSGLASFAGSMVPEVAAPAIGAVKRFASTVVSSSRIFKQGVTDAKNFLGTLVKEAPALPGLTKSSGLIEMQDPNYGMSALKAAFDQVDDKISKALSAHGKVTIPTPFQKALGAADASLLTAKPSQRIVQQIDAKDLPGAIKVIKQFARESGEDATGFSLRQSARLAEDSYKKLLQKVDPNLLYEYNDAVASFAKGSALIDLIKNSKAVLPTDKGPILDTEKLAGYLIQNVKKYPPTEYPSLWAFVGRGGPLGSSDVTKTFKFGSVGTGGRLHNFMPLPSVTTRKMAGAQPQAGISSLSQGLYDMAGIRAANTLTGGNDE